MDLLARTLRLQRAGRILLFIPGECDATVFYYYYYFVFIFLHLHFYSCSWYLLTWSEGFLFFFLFPVTNKHLLPSSDCQSGAHKCWLSWLQPDKSLCITTFFFSYSRVVGVFFSPPCAFLHFITDCFLFFFFISKEMRWGAEARRKTGMVLLQLEVFSIPQPHMQMELLCISAAWICRKYLLLVAGVCFFFLIFSLNKKCATVLFKIV